MKCDYCDNPAVVHETTMKNGKQKEVHLCQEHAAEKGIAIMTSGQPPINQLLTQFVITQHSGSQSSPVKAVKKACPACGLSFARFRQKGIVGCPTCYEVFETHLNGLIERAQNGGAHHVGKSPQRAGDSVSTQLQIQQLIKELDDAVAAEEYERAAKLRDRIDLLKEQPTR